ncbi:MAG: helix-turn-helix domain-containing protein [Chloroflexota bacterium]
MKDSDNIVGVLQRLGFGEYEARAYLALLQRNPLNGYELAKASGLPRANVYSVLQKLEERGAVMRLDMPSGTRYAPVAPSELTEQLDNRFRDDLEDARRQLEDIAVPAEREYIWNTQGYDLLLEHARTLVNSAEERLLVAIWPREAAALSEELAGAEARGVEVITLCLNACPRECGSCQGHIFRYHVVPEHTSGWLVLVADGVELLAGEIAKGNDALAVRTRQRLLVEVAAWYIRHSIALAAVVDDLGDNLQTLLSTDTLSALASLTPGGHHSDGVWGWLEFMQASLRGEAIQTSGEQ